MTRSEFIEGVRVRGFSVFSYRVGDATVLRRGRDECIILDKFDYAYLSNNTNVGPTNTYFRLPYSAITEELITSVVGKESQ